LLGTPKCGKTALINSFTDQLDFFEDYVPTIIDLYEQEMTMVDPTDGLARNVTLHIKDIGAGLA
jgi:GTPase SAR1 family protein